VRTDRDAAFEEMLSNPQDVENILRYARLSVQLREFEAAISALERLLDIQPNNATARLDLGISYFALGAYSVAGIHIEDAIATGALSDQDKRSAERYLEAIEKRSAPTSFSGEYALGAAYSDDVEAFGISLFGQLDWQHDLGGPKQTIWQTELLGNVLTFPGEDADRAVAVLRTGPVYSLSNDAFGPRLRPFLELDMDRDDDGFDNTVVSLGAQYQNSLSAEWAVSASLQAGKAWWEDEVDGTQTRAHLGLVYRPSRNTKLGLSLLGQIDDTDDDDLSRNSTALRFSFSQAFDSGFGSSDRKSVVRGYAQYRRDDFADSAADREDTRKSLGLSLRMFLSEDSFVEGSVSHVNRDSNVASVEKTENIYRLVFGQEF
jgi:tetratricopeptide (TPR) repeat protein